MQAVESDVRLIKSGVDVTVSLAEEIHGKNAEMYAAWEKLDNARKVAVAAGNGVMWVADKTARLARPIILLAILSGGGTLAVKIPEWVPKVLDLLK